MSTVATSRAPRRRDPVNLLLGAWGIVVFVFLFLPILMIVIYSFNDGRALVVWREFGLRTYVDALDNPIIRNAIFTSIRAALGAALISTVCGSLAGIALARRPGKWTIGFLALLFLVLVTPEIVDAIALLIWYVRIGGPFGPDNDILNYGLFRLWVAHSIFATAVVTLIVRARLAGLDEALEEASADLYASPAQTFRKITLPLMMPAVLAGGLLAFSLSLDNTIISSFVSTANASPWPVYVLSSLRSILRPEIAAMSTLVLLLTLFALLLVAIVLRRGGASGEESLAIIAGTEVAPGAQP
ncbi:MAG TPA: ABC transporter permease [Actinomycetota bacterium]|nr:ABC transporter permease [Actinomycetota bacterium]